jgi:twitching motility two-component system response regulator PilG
MNQLVMVIDDSLTIRKILSVCLRRAGYEVVEFPDGAEALYWLASPDASTPVLILVDLGLPKLDGYEVIRHLKARPGLERTVIVILSKRDGMLDRIKGRLVGAHAYITKPFRTQTIIEVVQKHLGGADDCETTEQSTSNQLPALAQARVGSDQRAQRGTRP